jgi:hypothetical protein
VRTPAFARPHPRAAPAQPYIAEHAIDYDDSVEAWHGRLHTNFSCVGC